VKKFYVIAILFAVFFGTLSLASATVLETVSLFDDNVTITTSTGNYVLSPGDPSQLLGESALKSAERTSELAMAAVASDAGKLEAKQKKLDEDTTAYNDKFKAAKTEFDSRAADYKIALNKYDGLKSVHQGRNAAYTTEVNSQAAEVAQSDALPATQRSQANVNRLNTWKARLDEQRATLMGEKRNLDLQKAALDVQQSGILDFAKKAQTDLQSQYDSLKLRQQELHIKQGDAYRQLQLCYNYAKQIKKILADKYHLSTPAGSPAWTGAEERLKELSNRGFDGNTDKLSPENKGSGSPLFSKPK